VSINYNKEYKDHYLNINKVYPSVFALKFFLGKNPNFSLRDYDFKGKKILDIGFGDGRDLLLFNDLGFYSYGVEVNKEVVEHSAKKFKEMGRDIKVSFGFNDQTGFKDNEFDFVYGLATLMYLRNEDILINNVISHVYNILKKDGFFIGSFTRADSHVTKESKLLDKNRIIMKDPFYKQREGQIYYLHHSREEVVKDLKSAGFKNILVSEFSADWFGTEENHYLFVARK
jgi:SAM-dependent methyltransferase